MTVSGSVAVSFLGIGLMGSRQARRLLDAGYQLAVWNRSRDKAEALAPFGARVVDTPSEAARSTDIVILMLENGPIVTDVFFDQGLAEALQPGSIVVDMSSIKPAEAQQHAKLLSGCGIHHIDAPVSSGTLGAEQGALAIMAGGEAEIFARVEPILKIMGRPVHVGPHGAGQLSKLANQIVVGVTIGAVAEALLLAQRGRSGSGKGAGSSAGRLRREPHSRASWPAYGQARLRYQRPLRHPSQGPR